MSPVDWFAAFPIQPATEAVEALRQGWTELAGRPRPDFNPKTKEDGLTKRLKVYVENHVARERGLLGMWAAEDIIGDVDPNTGAMLEERRTDIVYGWNDDVRGMKLVFEFKRLGRQKKHRDHYLQDQGLGRFVTGIYSRKEAVAAMVGVLLDPEPEVVPPIGRHSRTLRLPRFCVCGACLRACLMPGLLRCSRGRISIRNTSGMPRLLPRTGRFAYLISSSHSAIRLPLGSRNPHRSPLPAGSSAAPFGLSRIDAELLAKCR